MTLLLLEALGAGLLLVGIVWFEEPATTVRMLLILGAVACIAGLKLTA